jgi:hypothetical protein
MTQAPQTTGHSTSIDTAQVLAHNYGKLARWLIVRLVIVAVLIAGPLVAVNVFGAPSSFWMTLPLVAGVCFLVWTLPRLGCGVRLMQCAKILRHYPLEYWPKVRRKKDTEWTGYATVYTVRLRVQGVKDEPWMWAINASGSRDWPEGTEDGVWFAGDAPFGGVLVVPQSNGLVYLNPADWEKEAPQREAADPERWARAKSAKIHKRNWKKPTHMLGA